MVITPFVTGLVTARSHVADRHRFRQPARKAKRKDPEHHAPLATRRLNRAPTDMKTAGSNIGWLAMLIIGLMSGTSADGVDVAICDIRGAPGNLTADLLHGATYEYDPPMRQRILTCCDPAESRVDQIAALHVDLAEVFAQRALESINEAGLTSGQIDLIGSHGQTLWHNVLPSGQVSVSLQIVEPAVIAERTGLTTISNFRARDIAAGGQGAPLTSYVDWLLLRHPQHWRAIQNIGGMGNVTFLPPLTDAASQPIAFDTGPGNALLDIAVAHFTDGALNFDRDGQMAGQGRVNEEWLDELLSHPYYARDYPKTTGRETFGTAAALDWSPRRSGAAFHPPRSSPL